MSCSSFQKSGKGGPGGLLKERAVIVKEYMVLVDLYYFSHKSRDKIIKE